DHGNREVAVGTAVSETNVRTGRQYTLVAETSVQRQSQVLSIVGSSAAASANTVARRQTNCSGSVWTSVDSICPQISNIERAKETATAVFQNAQRTIGVIEVD